MVRKLKNLKAVKSPALTPASARNSAGEEAAVMGQRFGLGRKAFAKISEVENIRLTDEMKQVFAEFDRQRLSPDERRRAIIRRFIPPR
jgi:hypothetical protein